MKVRIKKLSNDAREPAYQTEGSAGMDLCACVPSTVTIAPGARAVVPTGIAIEFPRGTQGEVRSRSGLAANKGIMVLNSPGTVDSDYRGEVKVILYNSSDEAFVINTGDRIAQLVLMNYMRAQIEVVGELSETARNDGGLGSTGV